MAPGTQVPHPPVPEAPDVFSLIHHSTQGPWKINLIYDSCRTCLCGGQVRGARVLGGGRGSLSLGSEQAAGTLTPKVLCSLATHLSLLVGMGMKHAGVG